MKELRQKIIYLINSSIKIGDRFKAIMNYEESYNFGDYRKDDIYELIDIDLNDISLPFYFKNIDTCIYFWLSFDNMNHFEKIGE